MGGTMRLGARDTIIHEDSWTKKGEASIASLVYRGAASVPERHRHRYEVNPDVVPELEKAGLRFVVESRGHPLRLVNPPNGRAQILQTISAGFAQA